MKTTSIQSAVALTLLCIGASASAQSSRGLPAGSGSSLSIYGIAATELVNVSNFNDGSRIGRSTRIENSKVTASRLGFIGSEDLGGGLSSVFNLEMGYALDTGTQSNASYFFNRGSFVGLRGGFGTLTVGRQWDVEDDVMSRYFIFGGYGVFQFSEFAAISDTVANSVKYIAPSMAGVTARALYGFGEGSANGHTTEFALNYAAGGPFEAGATWRTQKAATGYSTQLATLGASYMLPATSAGKFRLHGGYAYSKPEDPAARRTSAYDVGVVWGLPSANANITLDYVARDQRGTGDDSRFVRLGGEYFLSKRTSFIANVVSLTNKGNASQKFFGQGAQGKDQRVLSVGLRHAF
ncbi:porin [Diaphorobacter caeni]|uniref:porin n=1 Tax=Diaphorobacter caeni TaxID=2784387 RepID=UPI00188E09CA|nr:porin [Diaphorobacter caeni]MBF5005202.1 porin [Diaphorobacter caeni]